MSSHRNYFPLILGLAALCCLSFIVIAFMSSPAPNAAVAQPDTYLFFQYARAFAEGHPYQFEPGDPPSTGSTSHLYPFVLSLLYRAGFKDAALATGGLLLNALLYLASIALLIAIARRLDKPAAPLGALLCALNGQMLSIYMMQTDMGLFSFLALGALAALLAGRPVWLAAALALASLCRPEGLFLSGFLLALALFPIPRLAPLKPRGGVIAASLAGLLAFGGSLLINRGLTGSFQFESVTDKGVFATHGLAAGMRLFASHWAQSLREGVFSMAGDNRVQYAFPILGGALAIYGLLAPRRAKTGQNRPATNIPRAALWWGLCVMASLATVAQSGWDGIQQDKYWTWFLSVWPLCIAIGLRRLWRAQVRRQRVAVPLNALLLVLGIVIYQFFCVLSFAGTYAVKCSAIETYSAFLRRMGRELPAGARIGCFGHAGMAYLMPRQYVINTGAICSPAFAFQHKAVEPVEILRHRPSARFNYWALYPQQTNDIFRFMLGGQVAAPLPVFGAGNAYGLYKTDWSRIEGTTQPLSVTPRGRLTGALDVAYAPDEARCAYDIYGRMPNAIFEAFTAGGKLHGRDIAESGRLIVGAEFFNVHAQPGKPLRMVLRGAFKASLWIVNSDGVKRLQDFEFAAPLTLNVLADDQTVGKWIIPAPAKGDDFFESEFEIPAKFVTRADLPLTVGGDHLGLGYWFYQD